MNIPISTDVVNSQALEREGAGERLAHPLALDPYSPILPTRTPERNGADPLALAPYSPACPSRAPADRCAG